jgi:TRAP-type C4-dicarboxylate transport system permease small subunit
MHLFVKILWTIVSVFFLLFTTIFAWYSLSLWRLPYNDEGFFIDRNVVYRQEYVPFYAFFAFFCLIFTLIVLKITIKKYKRGPLSISSKNGLILPLDS